VSRMAGAVLGLGVLLAACSPRGTPLVAHGVTMLRFGYLNGGPTALLNGHVSFANGCVSLVDDQGVAVTGLWPSSAGMDVSTGSVQIVVDGVRLAEGAEVSMGGGAYKDEEFVTSLVGPIPEGCRGDRYWLLTGLVVT
jgi:hypothetical protein